MAECAKDAAEESGLTFDDIESVGIGCPGAIDKENGNVEFSNNLDFYDVPIVRCMEALLEKKVYVENDANAAAWGEYLAGSGRGTENMIMITLSTGVGGGISNAGEKILKPIRKNIKNYSFARFGKKQSVVQIAKLGNDAGIIGAALLWKNEP